jgi:CRP-like cAMP-binding protein
VIIFEDVYYNQFEMMMGRDKTSLLQFIHSTVPVSQQKAVEIADRFQEKTIAKNEFLLQEGKVCKEFHFLDAGFVWSYTHDVNGDDVTTNFYSNKQVVCEMFSFFKQQPTKENFQALTDCSTWFISFADLQIAFHSMPEFREFGRSMLVTAYADLKQRMLSMVQDTAEERYNLLIHSSPDIFQNAPLKYIASYLGVTSTSLSRIRKEISKR